MRTAPAPLNGAVSIMVHHFMESGFQVPEQAAVVLAPRVARAAGEGLRAPGVCPRLRQADLHTVKHSAVHATLYLMVHHLMVRCTLVLPLTNL